MKIKYAISIKEKHKIMKNKFLYNKLYFMLGLIILFENQRSIVIIIARKNPPKILLKMLKKYVNSSKFLSYNNIMQSISIKQMVIPKERFK